MEKNNKNNISFNNNLKYLDLIQLNNKFNKKYNYIFGLNGSGKTTLSNEIYKDKNIKYFIFNQNYINKNIYLEDFKKNKSSSQAREKNMTNIFLEEENICIQKENNKLSDNKKEIENLIEENQTEKQKIINYINNNINEFYRKQNIPIHSNTSEVEKIFFNNKPTEIQLDDAFVLKHLNILNSETPNKINYNNLYNDFQTDFDNCCVLKTQENLRKETIEKIKIKLQQLKNISKINYLISEINDDFIKISFKDQKQLIQNYLKIANSFSAFNENSIKLHNKAFSIYKKEDNFKFLNKTFNVKDLKEWIDQNNNKKNIALEKIESKKEKNYKILENLQKNLRDLEENHNFSIDEQNISLLRISKLSLSLIELWKNNYFKKLNLDQFMKLDIFQLSTENKIEKLDEEKLKIELKEKVNSNFFNFISTDKKIFSFYKKYFYSKIILEKYQEKNKIFLIEHELKIKQKAIELEKKLYKIKYYLSELGFSNLESQINYKIKNSSNKLEISFKGMNTLSNGEKRALCFSFFLTEIYFKFNPNQQTIILIDDPFDSNDYRVSGKLYDLKFDKNKKLKEFFDEQKKLTIIFLTHNIIIFSDIIRSDLSLRGSMNNNFKYFYNYKNISDNIYTNIFVLKKIKNNKGFFSKLFELNKKGSIWFFKYPKIREKLEEFIWINMNDLYKCYNNTIEKHKQFIELNLNNWNLINIKTKIIILFFFNDVNK